MKQTLVVLTLGACLSACGGGSTSPAATPANVGGAWSGTLQFTHISAGSPVQATQGLTMNLTETGASVGGAWATTNGTVSKSGTVSGTASATSFSGTFTFAANDTLTKASCTGTFAVSGAAGGNSLTWTSPGVTGNCADPPTNITILAVR